MCDFGDDNDKGGGGPNSQKLADITCEWPLESTKSQEGKVLKKCLASFYLLLSGVPAHNYNIYITGLPQITSELRGIEKLAQK